ncbi:putative phage abortive infection protein [Chryseobacterium luquanense]|uniref:Phage abortive infection protein n=1 Tax=Chryseobacterium luquanense TaxID=2983766 RepID=A0ABT3Y1Z3_9FLAO|nr:putative phage abortive infection protein [Chryseobacterium luquanense]MCX8532168.1 putative phage abortive infection protein [Chryseobacterium luquanense]
MIGVILLLIIVFFFIISFLYNWSGYIFIKKYKPIDNEYNTNLSQNSIFLLLLAILLLISAFIAVVIFSQEWVYKKFVSEKTGFIGDTIGGITNPFINSAAVIVTGLAFYMQYKANKLQIHIFKEQINEAKNQFTVDQSTQRTKNKIEQIETRFYEMLKLHKSNINELYYHGYNKESTGRKVFEDYCNEIKSIYSVVSLHSIYTSDLNEKEKLLITYKIFFYGLENELNKLFTKVLLTKSFTDDLSKYIYRDINTKLSSNGRSFGIGHASEISHIYRHLFLTVKFIASQPESLISYEQKRSYLRILRAQLSNHEQAMLFYNWYSGFGDKWEQNCDSGNRFLTDFRMIHNLYNELLHHEFKLEQIFDLNEKIKTEEDREDDYLFEFQT